MIDGNTLLARDWPAGPLIGRALALARTLEAEGTAEADVITHLDRVLADPVSVTAGQPGFELAQAVIEHRAKPEPPQVRDAPLDIPIWGRELIDSAAIRQMHDAMRLPVTVAGALMPDAHVGYGVPIGGVVALDGAVAPYMVGVDIACRMMLSVYPADALDYLDSGRQRDALKRAMREESRFGIGARFKPGERRSHAVLDDPDWEATPLLKSLKDKAHAQLGTSGTGNHFVDAGRLEVDEARDVIVHRKGATPAGEGVLGVVPGSQGHPSYVVRGLGSAASLASASHGAGRQMGRKQAIRTIDQSERDAWLAERGVELLAGGMDEAPQAYKDIDEVLALQADLAQPVAAFHPEVVLMASDGKSEG